MPHGIEQRKEEGFKSGYLFVIAVEGAEAEPAYFATFQERKAMDGGQIRVEVLSPSKTDGLSTPEDVLDRMDKRLRQGLRVDAGDELWIVFDADHHTGEKIQKIVDMAKETHYQIAISNPCFEIWLYWLLSDYPAEKAQMLRDLEQEKRPRQMKADYGVLKHAVEQMKKPHRVRQIENLSDAIRRARESDTDSTALLPALPSTRVYRLVERLKQLCPDL